MYKMKVYLNNQWSICSDKIKEIKCKSPCTVLSSLLGNGIIEDPYFGKNEIEARKYLQDDYTFSSTFSLGEEQLENYNYLFIDGLLTIAIIYINDVKVCESFDYHLSQTILLDNKILRRENIIKITFKSPYKYIRDYPNPKNLYETYAVTDKDSPKIRQPNCMFGWDWAPDLADIGITKPLYILSNKVGYLESFKHHYVFSNSKVDVEVIPFVSSNEEVQVEITLSGFGFNKTITAKNEEKVVFSIDNPQLWYPAGYGEQPLYNLVFVVKGKKDQIQQEYKIGIRKIFIDDSFDKIGRNFALYVNDKKIFIKGSNLVPEDSILTLVTKERTQRLLDLAKASNQNLIRVWGGGYYPSDDFYEYCDEIGLLVFQDLMFACASYNIDDPHFRGLVCEETRNSLRRIRHHASLFIIAGNNEIEDGVRGHGYLPTKHCIKMFHELLKNIVNEETDFYYLSSSPTSGEPYFSSPNDTAYLDTHYWWVWGNDYPLEMYKTIQPRLLSEFGLESYPTYETICKFTKPEERTPNSDTLCFHQKMASHSNEKMEKYVASLFKPSEDMQAMCYLTMLMQAEGIKMCVENLRQHKERCNGAIYWQLNDCWPGQSWSIIDYYFGIKAIHYYLKKMYAPHLVSFKEEKEIYINVSNDTDKDCAYKLRYSFFDIDGNVLNTKNIDINIDKYQSKDALKVEQMNEAIGIYASLSLNGEVISDNYFFFHKDKDIQYKESKLSINIINNNEFEITADTFARAVCIVAPNGITLSDNYFNLLKGETKRIICSKEIANEEIKAICLNNLY